MNQIMWHLCLGGKNRLSWHQSCIGGNHWWQSLAPIIGGAQKPPASHHASSEKGAFGWWQIEWQPILWSWDKVHSTFSKGIKLIKFYCHIFVFIPIQPSIYLTPSPREDLWIDKREEALPLKNVFEKKQVFGNALYSSPLGQIHLLSLLVRRVQIPFRETVPSTLWIPQCLKMQNFELKTYLGLLKHSLAQVELLYTLHVWMNGFGKLVLSPST